MRRALPAVVGLVLAVAACGGSDGDDAIEPFAPPGGGYTVEFVDEPTATEIPVALPTGQSSLSGAWIDESDDGAAVTYFVDYDDLLGDQYVPWDDTDAQLESIRDGSLDAIDATLGDSETVELDGHPGIRWTFTFEDGGVTGHGVSVAYVDEAMMYYTGGVGIGDDDTAAATFVDSFQFADASTAGPDKESDE